MEATTKQHANWDGTPKQILRHRALDLYIPSDIFRSLGLPIIDWQGEDGNHNWRSNSEEGMPDVV